MNRRQFVSASAMAALARPLAAEPSYREELRDMLVQFIQKKMNALNQRWDAERAAVRSPARVRERNRFVREKFLEMIHGLPERVPLNARVVSVHQRQGYRIENVLFQSRPDFWVNGTLYLPDAPGPHPAVLSPCGHADEGHVYEVYQQAHFDFVKSGLVVLTYDPIGQGERRVYWNPRTGETEVGGCTYEHSMFGQMLLLMGEDMAHYCIWDGMRGIDYLLTRPEVDPARIGCAGQSGGGTLPLYLSALDRRIQCAVVSEGGTAARWPLDIRENQRFGPADAEQNLFPGAFWGIDQPDLHAAIAPTPLLVLIEQYSPRFNQAAGFIRERYRLLGLADRFATEEAGDPHGWTRKLRLATTNWLRRWLLGAPPLVEEPVLQPERPEDLHCAPNGSLRHSQIGDSIFSLILKKQAGLRPPEIRPDLSSLLARLIRYRRLAGSLAPRSIAVTQRQGYRVEKLAFLSEPGIYIPVWVFVPDSASSRLPVTLFVVRRVRNPKDSSAAVWSGGRESVTLSSPSTCAAWAKPGRPTSPVTTGMNTVT
jgi:dienelactone hydrolase